ncbi:hypothetical protein B0T17DRAFT_529384 [Bombardia bombarda]|uniref:Guanine nucleotide-exchange factor SEC12 n=1 Tax=Bombardia bombarda TaxID=252184 RepID=A0AA40CA69_9PEZI|nr:hypothetical protein B0T17DRAFT_529384 [Bombardia bombarda]
MAPSIPSSEHRLDYPLYAVDFDPQDANRVVVGGGGGAGRSGVGNKITVLDASHQEALQVVSELDLSRDEDSVNTLAVGPRRKNALTIYAGINSSEASIKKGKNEHFRVFGVDPTPKAKSTSAPKITELSRSTLFSSKDPEAYQRVLRISPPFPEPSRQVGAVATGLAKDPQITIFDIPFTSADGVTPKLRGEIEPAKEAMDLDLLQTGDDEWQLVYCNDYEIYTKDIGGKGNKDAPTCVFTMPHNDSRPSFRSIRYLSPTFVLAVANLPKAGGVVLQGFRLPKPEQGQAGTARLALSAHLPTSVARATGMAVRGLSPRASPSAKQENSQFVVAVTGQDSSITIYTLNHQVMGDINLINRLYPVTTIKAVHPGPISGIAFSRFVPPPPSSSKTPTPTPKPTLKLASIGSMGNTCVVHTLPLKKIVESSSTTTTTSASPTTRYILALKSHDPMVTSLFTFVAIILALAALLAQGFCEVKGISRPIIGARHYTPVRWHETWTTTRPASLIDDSPHQSGFLAQYLAEKHQLLLGTGDKVVLSGDAEGDAVKIGKHEGSDGGLGGEEEKVEGAPAPATNGREWDQLPLAEKLAWKAKLKKAGHWGEEMGEAVFKGVLFGEIGGLVANIVGA